jgi:hypothetical protein
VKETPVAVIEELKKACEETAEFGAELLKKSQMGFDFGGPGPNPHAHKAYTRTNARGTVSHVEQKGTPEQPVTVQAANPGKRYAIPPPPAADQRAAAAAMVKPEMTLVQIKAAIETQHVSTEDFIGDLQPGQITILRTTTGTTQRVKIVPEGRAPNPALAKPIRRTKA